jgi:hypothetical protein
MIEPNTFAMDEIVREGGAVAAPECDLERLNSLLRGEMAAAESYEEALDRFADRPTIRSALAGIGLQHRRAAETLREEVLHFGGEPALSSGSWGSLALLATDTAALFGGASLLVTLRRGEEQGLFDYEDDAGNEGLAMETRALLRNELTPECRRHIRVLDDLLRLGEIRGAE